MRRRDLWLVPAVVLAMFVVLPRPAAALYAEIDLEEVPIDRLVANMERRAAENPRDAEAQHRLARIHAMAYSVKRDSLIIEPQSQRLWVQSHHVPFVAQAHQAVEPRELEAPQIQPIDGPAPARAPAPPLEKKPAAAPRWRGSHPGGEAKVQTTDDPQKQAVAKEHLEKAIAHYKKAADLAPDNLTIALGHAWTLDQSGRKDEAVAGYRRVVKAGWEQEQKLLPQEKKVEDMVVVDLGDGVGPDWQSVTSEAAGYLIPHLDATKDAAEIAILKERVEKLTRVNRAVTPLVIPLEEGARVRGLVDPNARVQFDADGSGMRRTWTWITPCAGWLVIDRRGSGQVRSALQMFGSVSYWCFWQNGYQALAALDDNNDGELTGPELRDLAIWRDANSNGISDPGEVQPLSAWGIVALSCRGKAAMPADLETHCASSAHGVRFQDGGVRATYDVILRQSARN